MFGPIVTQSTDHLPDFSMADFGRLAAKERRPVKEQRVNKQLRGILPAVSEHIGQEQAMPQQGIVQHAEQNTEKSDQDQADLEAAAVHAPPAEEGASPCRHFEHLDTKKLTRGQKSSLVDQVLKVSTMQINDVFVCRQLSTALAAWLEQRCCA